MRINDNGKYRDMTSEEESEFLSSILNSILTYEQRVEIYIRERYSISQEIAILRQKAEKPAEYEEWYSYAESCKQRAKAELVSVGLK